MAEPKFRFRRVRLKIKSFKKKICMTLIIINKQLYSKETKIINL